MSREFIMVVQESSYKTPVSSPTVGTSAIYIRLDGGNAFGMRPRPVQVAVPYGGGVAIDAFRVSDKLELKGALKTKLFASQSAFLLGWAGVRVNAGQTQPWTTTDVPGDLASCAIYHAIQRSDGTFKRRVYLGCKVDSWDLEISEESTLANLNLNLSASTAQGNSFDSSTDPTSTTFPNPLDTYLPIDPFLFIHTSGGLTIGSSRATYSGIKISSRNVLARRFWANRFIGAMQFVGRATTMDVTNFYASSPDDRSAYEALTTQTTTVTLNNGTHAATIGLNAQNVFTGVEDQTPLDDLYLQNLTLANMWDPVAGTDILLMLT